MVEDDFAKVSTVRQVVGEIDLASKCDVATKFVPPGKTNTNGLAQGLQGS